MPQLRIQTGDYAGTAIPLDGRPVTIGSDPTCSVPMPLESMASPHQATFHSSSEGWHVRDEGGGTGVLVNGESVQERLLREGDVIMLGDVFISFEAAAVAVAVAAPAAVDEVTQDPEVLRLVREMSQRTRLIEEEIGKAIIGQKEIVRDLLTAVISKGHVLMIGMPGLAKTTLVRTVSEVLDLKFRRIQFTPDLMPTDITGTDILEVDEVTGKKEYRFIKGPIFTNILLADEINRTPPKTQAALLEAMQEHCVTAAGHTYELDPPFFVLATQNPLEQEGTYPLPEAQLDRFMFSILIDYPSEQEEETIAKVTTRPGKVILNKILNAVQINEIQRVVREIPISDHVVKYAVRLVRATRPADMRAPEFVKKWIHCGAGPRAAQYLIAGAKARAVIDGRLLVTTDDVRSVAPPILRHRMFTNFTADSEGMDTDKIVKRMIAEVPEPDERDY
jgi:MoxR-like ATPase